MRMSFAILVFATLAGCGDGIVDPVRAAEQCEMRARGAQAPTGEVTFGVNNRTGASSSARIGITSDFVRGLDPDLVYDRCIFEKTGSAPIRRPVLR